MQRVNWPLWGAGALLIIHSSAALAHDPVFGIGPHVLFKNGMEAAAEIYRKKADKKEETGLAFQVAYGITGEWSAGIDVPYSSRNNGTDTSSGLSDLQAFTKYRFWREDSLGLQESAAVMLAINADNADEKADPALGNGATDVITGITYGYESIKSYRWASARYIFPGKNAADFQAGNKWRVDFVAGWRPAPPEYKKPDTVWLLELNGEITDKAELNGNSLMNTGGTEWFLSPGIFWTTRNFAIKSGIQVPVASDLNGTQDKSDYRFKATFEWHL
ncbi:MAG: transporter [Gammaproteobacteria bacterium]|nr:transporter [Gammaproteobacteria bacterium]